MGRGPEAQGHRPGPRASVPSNQGPELGEMHSRAAEGRNALVEPREMGPLIVWCFFHCRSATAWMWESVSQDFFWGDLMNDGAPEAKGESAAMPLLDHLLSPDEREQLAFMLA